MPLLVFLASCECGAVCVVVLKHSLGVASVCSSKGGNMGAMELGFLDDVRRMNARQVPNTSQLLYVCLFNAISGMLKLVCLK